MRSGKGLLWLVLAASWFGGLGYLDLTHPDEGRYSEISREMASTGDWVTPRLNGLKYFEKPPLQYWATALLFRAFGESEFVARLWVGLCGFATVILVYSTALRLWDARFESSRGNVAPAVLVRRALAMLLPYHDAAEARRATYQPASAGRNQVAWGYPVAVLAILGIGAGVVVRRRRS